MKFILTALLFFVLSSQMIALELKNEMIVWDGDIIGVTVYVPDEKLADGLMNLPTKTLIASLQNKDSWIIAHVILSLRYKDRFIMSPPTWRSPTTWNGLSVRLNGDGSVYIDPAQQEILIKYWANEMKSMNLRANQ